MPEFKRVSATILLVISMLLVFQSTGLWNLNHDDAFQQNDAVDQSANFVLENSVTFGFPETPELTSEIQTISCNVFIPSFATALRRKSTLLSCHSIRFLSDAGLMPRAPELA